MYELGLRRPAAAIANRLYKGRTFEIDAEGHWVNRQPKCTFVSPTPFAQSYAYVRDKIVDEWLFDYTPGPTDIVVDAGAGFGEEAIIFSDMAATVYAIEAHPDTFRCLEQTVTRSGRTNVVPLHLALADADGELTISNGEDHLGNSIVTGTDLQGFKVPARSLETLCRDHGLSRIDFLKINIEGAERLAIRGFGAVDIRHLAISCHDFVPQPEMQTREEVERFLRDQGYEVRRRSDHPRPWTRQTLYARKA